MRKRICALLLLVVIGVFSVCSLTACDDDEKDVGSGLRFDVKYVHLYNIRADENEFCDYYVFHRNGSGEYRYMNTAVNTINYTITFKYTYLDNEESAVGCFYDSVSYGDGHQSDHTISPTWHIVLMVSKNVVMKDDTMYINASYIGELSNFGKLNVQE